MSPPEDAAGRGAIIDQREACRSQRVARMMQQLRQALMAHPVARLLLQNVQRSTSDPSAGTRGSGSCSTGGVVTMTGSSSTVALPSKGQSPRMLCLRHRTP